MIYEAPPEPRFEKHVKEDSNGSTRASRPRRSRCSPCNNNCQRNLPDTRTRPDLDDHLRLRQLSWTTSNPSRNNEPRRSRHPTTVRKQPTRNPHLHNRIYRNRNSHSSSTDRDYPSTPRPPRTRRTPLHLHPVPRPPQQPLLQRDLPRTLRSRPLQHIS